MGIAEFELDVDRGSECVTDGVRVCATPTYLDRHSDPKEGRFIFGYFVRITNEGATPVQLLERTWHITDADGQSQLVQGEGVIGVQPRLGVGETHEYTSFCPLGTPWGTMEGSYLMVRDDGSVFDAAISRFYLVATDEPDASGGLSGLDQIL